MHPVRVKRYYTAVYKIRNTIVNIDYVSNRALTVDAFYLKDQYLLYVIAEEK